MNYHIITFGCQMNKSDSQRIATALENKSYLPASDINEADLIVVNMCSVRQSAVNRVYGLFHKFKKLKEKNQKLKTVLTGCILKKDEKKFKNYFNEVKKMPQDNCPSTFIPISNGCNNFCAYCVVPFTRGSLVCRDHKEILKEVKNLTNRDFKEIWLLGQNVNDYTSPTDSSGEEEFSSSSPSSPAPTGDSVVNFPKLLKLVSELPGKFSVRFMSPHPMDFSDELIDVIAQSKKVLKYINLPVQSGDNKILKKMNRPYTVSQYKNLVKKIRKKIPQINLSTDVIVGFPGETKKQFENTVKLFKEIKFDIAYVAKYSPRPGTAAFKMQDNVPLEEKKRREKILRDILKKDLPR